MPSLKRVKTKYPGVYYVMGRSLTRTGKFERIYYIRYRKNGKEIEEKAGRQFQDAMSAERAAKIRSEIIEGRRLSRKETRLRRKKARASQQIIRTRSSKKGVFKANKKLLEERWLEFTRSAVDSFSLYDSELNLIAINEAGLRLLPKGSTLESVKGRNVWELIPDYYYYPERERKFKEIIKTGEPFFVDDVLPSSNEGDHDYINIRAFKVYDGIGIVITLITERKRSEEALRKQQTYLDKIVKQRTINLEEANTALKVLLKRREEDKKEFEEKMVLNVKELIQPYLEKLKNGRLNDSQKGCLGIIESNLNDIISPLVRGISTKHLRLTHAEIQIANLVKQGKTTKEISELLFLSPRTIESYRDNIRKKLGIKNKKINLRTYLSSVQ